MNGNKKRLRSHSIEAVGVDETTQITQNGSCIAFNLPHFCKVRVPDFTPLGGSRPDAAVVGCAVMSLYSGGLAEGVIVAPDVLDTALAMLCAPMMISHRDDISNQKAAFECHAVSLRLSTTDDVVMQRLRSMNEDGSCKLMVVVRLINSTDAVPEAFMSKFNCVTRIDLKGTVISKIGNSFAAECPRLTAVAFPTTLTEVGNGFLRGYNELQILKLPDTVTAIGDSFLEGCTKHLGCNQLQAIDLNNTALQRVGRSFASRCRKLTTVALPDTLTVAGDK